MTLTPKQKAMLLNIVKCSIKAYGIFGSVLRGCECRNASLDGGIECLSSEGQ